MNPRLFVVADVSGPDQYHLGDEAMLEANLHALRQLIPGIEFTVPSGDPAWTSKRYGVESVAFPRVPHGQTAEGWLRKMADAADAGRRWTDWLGGEITESLRNSTGVLISGGGNLCATWPDKILERAAIVEYAREAGIPAAMSCQTIGPALTPDQRRLLGTSLRGLGWLGVREDSSAALASALGVSAGRIHKQFDDAFFLGAQAVEDERAAALREERRPWIVVTLDASFGAAEREQSLSMLASQLDSLADCLGAALVFAPHVGGRETSHGHCDAAAGEALAKRLRSKLLLLDLWQPREVRWLAGKAAMVISTRYHGLVFATAAGVAPLGIYTDDYTRSKLRGALAHAGMESWCVPLAEADRGALLALAMELWHRRREVCERLVRLRAEAWPQEQQRWGEICGVLNLKPRAADPLPEPAEMTQSGCACHARERAAASIGDEQWREYEQKGYLRLGRVLDDEELAALQERIDGIMLGRVRYPTLQMQLDTGGAYEDLPDPVAGHPEATLAYRKLQGLEADPLVLEFIRRDLFREICAWHYGKHAAISIFRAMVMNKPAGQGTYLPWHQDAGDVWKLDRDPLVTTWIALDRATRMNGCVQVIPGSHRLGLLSKNGSTLSPEHVRQYCPDGAAEYLELEAGEGLLLHNWLLHRSDINHTDRPRRALSACYMDGRTLNTLTGTRFPMVFGDYEDVDSSLPFLRYLKEDNQRLRETAVEAERYAISLLEHNRRLEEGLVSAMRRVLRRTISAVRNSGEPAAPGRRV